MDVVVRNGRTTKRKFGGATWRVIVGGDEVPDITGRWTTRLLTLLFQVL